MSWLFDPTERRVARCIEGDHPQWYVTWGVYSRIYSAFPLFHSPAGTVLTARHARDLVALMREAEIEFGPLPPARKHESWPEAPVPHQEELPASYEQALLESYEQDLPWPYEQDLPEPDEPGRPSPGDPEPWPSEELALLPAGPEAGWPEADGEEAGWPEADDEEADWPEADEEEADWPEADEPEPVTVRRERRYPRFSIARRGQ
jgi:hypothetical protein